MTTPKPVHSTLPLDGVSRWPDLKPFVALSREWIRKRELEGKFPKRIFLNKRCAVWQNREIHRWLADPLNYRAEEA